MIACSAMQKGAHGAPSVFLYKRLDHISLRSARLTAAPRVTIT